jgi:hypothetical protein
LKSPACANADRITEGEAAPASALAMSLMLERRVTSISYSSHGFRRRRGGRFN